MGKNPNNSNIQTVSWDAFDAVLESAPIAKVSGSNQTPEPTEKDRAFAVYVDQNRTRFTTKNVPAAAFEKAGVNVAAVNSILTAEHGYILRATRADDEAKTIISYRIGKPGGRKGKTKSA